MPSDRPSSGRWQRAQELFEELLKVPEGERGAWLEERCRDDAALRALVRSMVASDEASEDFLEVPLARLGEDQAVGSEPLEAGQILGSYRILERLGEGGMSTVYRAERADAAFDLQVVVKVVRHGLETEDNLRRLRAERQILAGLDHPNISRLYDGGTTSGNLPYFVMEYVDGEPIDEFCDRRALNLRQRIELFAKVCRAVGYAHRQLVIHRDLKPANLLVTQEGAPKLLDFGIAKLLDRDVDNPQQTSAFLRRLTPDYASPEQLSGARITTASDVYSLGVMLYLLLTGSLPRVVRDQTFGSYQKAAAERPTAPSRAVKMAVRRGTGEPSARIRGAQPDVWRRQLEGDLDAIVLKALQGAPEDRYPSVDDFLRDLEAYLQGFPVKARVASPGYRSGKFVRRHRVGVAASAVILGLAATTFVSFVRHARETARQRDELQAVVSSVKGLLNVAGEGEKLSARQIVDRSSAMVEKTLAGRPWLEGSLRETMGSIYLNLGVPDRALEQLEQSYLLRSNEFGRDSLEAASSQSALGLAAARVSDSETARAAATQALDTALERMAPDSLDLLGYFNNLVTVLCVAGDLEAAEPHSRTALGLAQRAPEDRLEKAKAFSNRAYLLAEEGRLEEAHELYRRALAFHQRHRGEEHPDVLGTLNNISLLLGELGQAEEAERVLQRTLDLQRKLLGEKNPEVIRTLNNLAGALRDRGELARAEATQQEAVALAREVLPPGHFASLMVQTRLAEIQVEMGGGRGAARLLREGLAIWRESLPDSWFVGHAESVLGLALVQEGSRREGEELLLRGYLTLRRKRGRSFQRTEEAAQRIEGLYRATGRERELHEILETDFLEKNKSL